MNVIEGPIEGHAHMGVVDKQSYLRCHEKAIQKSDQDVFEVTDPIDAYISHGRWVISCICNGAGLTSRSLKVSCCFDCGRVYTRIVFPRNAKKIEEELLKRRDQSNRNWHGESLQVLMAETAKHSDIVRRVKF